MSARLWGKILGSYIYFEILLFDTRTFVEISNSNYGTINSAFVGLHLLLNFSIAEDLYCVLFDHIKSR